MKGGDTNEKDDDRIGLGGSNVRGWHFIGSGSNQKPFQGSDKKHLSDRNSGPESHSGPAKKSNKGPDPNQGPGKGRFPQKREITAKLSGKKG